METSMNLPDPRAREIFEHAVEIESPDEQTAFVEQACDGDPLLLVAVEQLLKANRDATGLMENQGDADNSQLPSSRKSGFLPTVDPPATERSGAVLGGRYKLLENIGEGGMGSVWVAEQQQPVKRRVAIKLVKAGMDSKQVLARFESERQALAVMDHPNIAKVFDGGMTEQGRPYFVMEYVKGVPFTD
jgi:eukaryotic-like serine/threonine-protein kinase